jgi:hypothetical protein
VETTKVTCLWQERPQGRNKQWRNIDKHRQDAGHRLGLGLGCKPSISDSFKSSSTVATPLYIHFTSLHPKLTPTIDIEGTRTEYVHHTLGGATLTLIHALTLLFQKLSPPHPLHYPLSISEWQHPELSQSARDP